MKEIHILVTGVGRRVELMQAFRQAALNLNINSKLYGADMAGTAPALVYCDYTRKVCSMHDKEYIQQLIDICVADKIDVLIPTIDTDLLILSKNTEKFDKVGTKVLISKSDKILICRDKNNTGEFFESCGLKAPRTYNNYKNYPGPYPCFIKPKDGSSSINAFRMEKNLLFMRGRLANILFSRLSLGENLQLIFFVILREIQYLLLHVNVFKLELEKF